MSKSYHDDEQIEAKHNAVLFPLTVNLILLVSTIIILWVAVSQYQARMNARGLRQDSFITTEWHLLQELKNQTDRELMEKEQEIAELRKKYAALKNQNASRAELEEMEARLSEANEERKELLARRNAAPGTAEAEDRGAAVSAAPPSLRERSGAVQALLQERVEALRQQRDTYRQQSEALRSDLATLEEDRDRLIADYEQRITNNLRRIERLERQLEGLREELEAALTQTSARMAEVDSPAQLSLEEIKTRALLQALAASPELRREYPQLAGDMRAYFDSYRARQRAEGERRAYASTIELLRGLQAELSGAD